MSTVYKDIKVAGGDTARPLTMSKRLGLIGRHVVSARRFLDCGCGPGAYVLALKEQFGLDAHGIELREDKVKIAQARPGLEDRVAKGDLMAIDFPDNAWDYCMLNEVLEHVPDDRRALSEVHRILKPGGLLFIFSPNRWFPFETHGVMYQGTKRKLPHWVPFVPYMPVRLGKVWFDYWARNYWQGELKKMAEASGFEIIERSFVWITFEGISRNQPWLIRVTKPVLRGVSNVLEKLPLIRRFGVSQVLVCRKSV